jgi:hypothetical protein
MILAPVLGIFGFAFVTLSHALPIVMAAELAPDFAAADAAARSGLQTTGDLMAGTAPATNYIGDILLWGWPSRCSGSPCSGRARSRAGIGWLGIFIGVFGGWIGAFGSAASVLEDISTLGFNAFFVWMPAMGIAMLRPGVRQREAATPPDAVPQACPEPLALPSR